MHHDEMTPAQLADEARQLGVTLPTLHSRLEARIRRDQAYLRRRRLRGISTPTDETMEADLLMLGYLCMLSAGPQVAAYPFSASASSPGPIQQIPPADSPVSITESEHLTDE